ncbi:MAG: DUF805 domain-containing protein [Flavobacterium sp.]|nr:DUF805 domain-containing protein [Flavobacterium sp.]
MKYYVTVLSKYAVFSGRARRSEYWFFVLFNFIVSTLLLVLDFTLHLNFLHTIYLLVVIIPSIAVGVRRMHDVGKSGWYLLIPIYNLILVFTEGTRGENEYGADPKNKAII